MLEKGSVSVAVAAAGSTAVLSSIGAFLNIINLFTLSVTKAVEAE
jgi:hypothetical protein